MSIVEAAKDGEVVQVSLDDYKGRGDEDRERMEQGELLKDAFRAEMAGVRAVLENDG